MDTFQYILGIVAALLTLGIVIEMLRRRQLRERHAIWWFAAGVVALIISIFPNLLTIFANYLGFEVPANLAFFAALLVLFLVALQTSAELTQVETHNRRLAEQLALVELRVDKLEKRIRNSE
jgi:hypothetical protein